MMSGSTYSDQTDSLVRETGRRWAIDCPMSVFDVGAALVVSLILVIIVVLLLSQGDLGVGMAL
jgi:hypothetical protein